MSFKSGFIAIIGRPNAGKSTLINQIMHSKVAIVSDKAQTTRNSIRAIVTDENSQLIFIDTPGIHKPKSELGRQMNRVAYSSLSGVDVIYYIFDGSESFGRGDEYVMEYLKKQEVPIFCVVNKIDSMAKGKLLELLMKLNATEIFSEIIPISAKTGDNVDRLFELTRNYMPEGVKYYPDEMKVDYPEQFILGEIIREKLLARTKEEIPHSIAVVFDQFAEKKESILIVATILVETGFAERDRHRERRRTPKGSRSGSTRRTRSDLG
jgi:GTPase